MAGFILFLLMAFLHPKVVEAKNTTSVQRVILTQDPNNSLVVTPDPPQVNEPIELRVVLFNNGDNPITLYAQFYWANFGLGTERFPIEGRIEFILPPHGEGSTAVVWVPPIMKTYCFYVDIFDAPEAQVPVSNFWHNVTYRGYPDPETSLYIEAVPLSVRNPLTEQATMVLSVTVPITATAWEARIYPPQATLNPGESIFAQTIFTYTGEVGLPPGGLESFLLSGSLNEQPMGEGEVVFGPPLRLHLGAEPQYAESEISVNPYPILPGEPTEICVKVRNVTPQSREGVVTFRYAPLGIGMPYMQIGPPIPISIPLLGIQRPCTYWVPPYGGQFSFEAQVEAADFPMVVSSQRVMDVGELLLPGTISTLYFPVHNPIGHPVTITLSLQLFMPDWLISISPAVLNNMGLGETRLAILTVEIPPGADMPQDEAPVADVVAFAGSDIIGGLRMIYRPPVPIHQPGDPIYGESEITVHPYPPREREPTEICVELRNPTEQEQSVTVDFNVAAFGIGLPFHAIAHPKPVTLPPHSTVKTCITWVPPFGGRFGAEVGIQLANHEKIYSQRVIDVGEILLPNQLASFEFPVGNPNTFPITVTMGAKRYLPQWEVTFDPPMFELSPGGILPVVMHVLPVQEQGDPEPQEGEPVIDVEAYWSGNGENGFLGGFRKLFFPPVPIHLIEDPPFAEREINIFPYPPHAGEPTHLEFEARNPTTATQQITVTFEVGNFGIGLPFTPIAVQSITLSPFQTGVTAVTWVPSSAGEFCVRVKVEAPFFTKPFYSSRNISIVLLPEPYGTPEVFIFVMRDNGDTTRPLTVTLGLKEYLPNWHVELGSNKIVFVSGQTIATSVMTITPPTIPEELPLDGGPIADISAYVDGNLIGGIRKVWRPPVPLGQLGEPGYAESEIVIDPDPPVVGQPTTFAAQVRNDSDYTQIISLQFGWANFGFGIPFTTTNVVPTQTVIILSPHMTTTVSANWTPLFSGNLCVQILLRNEQMGEFLRSQRNINVIEVPENQCEPIVQKFPLQNGSPETVTVTIGASAIDLLPAWAYSIDPDEVVLNPYESIMVTVVITPPCYLNAHGLLQPLATLGASSTRSPTKIQVEGYDQNGVLAGGVELQLVTAEQQPIYLPSVMRSSGMATGGDARVISLLKSVLQLFEVWMENPLWLIFLFTGGVSL